MTRHISQSELKTFRRCRRKWWLTNVRKLEFDRPPGAGARYLGTKVHRGLEAYYTVLGEVGDLLSPQHAYAAVQAIHDEDVEKVRAWYEEKELDPAAKVLELEKETDLAFIILQGYFDWLEETAADANLRVVCPELELDVPFLEGWNLVGKVDLQVVREDSGFTSFLDHKVVANLTDIPKQAAQSEQGLMYNVLLRLAFGKVVDGMDFNMLRKVKRTKAANPPFYGRHTVRFNTAQLNEFATRIQGIVHDIADVEARLAAGWSHQMVAYPNPTGDCSWDCDFYAVCSMFDDGSRVEDALAGHYRTCDPLARYTIPHQEAQEC